VLLNCIFPHIENWTQAAEKRSFDVFSKHYSISHSTY
jgi:hypothetical protein